MPKKTAKTSAETADKTAVVTATGASPSADPAALSPDQLATLLGLPAEKVRAHLEAGAPAGAMGTINLVQYVAWLNQRLKERDGD